MVQCLVVGVFYENERGFGPKVCEYRQTQSRSPSLRSSGRNARLWDNPLTIRFREESDWPLKWMRSSILARIPGFRQRIIPEPRVPSRGSQARVTSCDKHKWRIIASGGSRILDSELNVTNVLLSILVSYTPGAGCSKVD